MATFKSWSESDQKSTVNCEGETIGGKKYNKTDLLEVIKATLSEIKAAELKKKKLNSMDNRLLAIIKKKGHYIKM